MALLASMARCALALTVAVLCFFLTPVHAADPSSLWATENGAGFYIAAKDSHFFWYAPACASELLPPTVFIRVGPPYSPAYTLFNPPECPSIAMDSNTRIAIDDGSIWWADGQNNIVRLSRNAWPPQPTVFTPMSALPRDLVELAVDDMFVYWLEGRTTSGRIVRIPKAAGGGAPLSWSIANTNGLSMLRLDSSGRPHVLSGGTLTRLVPNPASLTFTPQSIGALGLVSKYAIASDRVYWVQSDITRQRLDLVSASLDNPAAITLHRTLTATGSVTVQDMTVDSSNIYWIENRPNRTYAIVRMARSGGPPVDLASYGPTDVDQPYQIVSVGSSLFWSIPLRAQIRQLPISAPGLDLTTDGRGPMVVQVVQSPANDVLLIAGKPTVVRAFGRIDLATAAKTIVVNPSATLAGTRDGTPLPGSPLTPRSNQVQLSTALDIRDSGTASAVDGLTFDLPESWTRGTVTLTASLNPGRTTLESDFSNNTASSTVTFVDPISYCLQFAPIRTAGGTITGPSASITSYVDRATSVFPLVQFRTGFLGGPPLMRPRLPFGAVQGFDPWVLNNDFEMGYLLWTMWWNYVFGTGFICQGAGTTVLGPVDSSWRWGMASPNVLTYQMPPGANPISSPQTGLAGIAHELGHEFGLKHVACPSGPGAPANTDSGYPYPPCQLSANTALSHVGYDALLQSWLLPGSTADMMTYSGPLWVSDYTYMGLSRPLGLPIAFRFSDPPSGGTPVTLHLIGGLLGEYPIMGYAFPIDSEQAQRLLQRMQRRAQASTELELHVRNSQGETLSRSALNLLPIDSEGGPPASMFFNIVELPASAARLDVVAVNGSIVTSRAAGPASPKVMISHPPRGQRIGETLKVIWSGSDADKDPLLYLVRYSHDDRKSWHVLVSNSTNQSVEVASSSLPGGTRAYIEVTASDGLHFDRAVVGPFEVAQHPAKAMIFESDREISIAAPVAIAQSRPLTLRGVAFDGEDQEISSQQLAWSLSGPVTAEGNGARWRVEDLPPGRYRATLTAKASDRDLPQAQAAITVLPKRIAEATEEIVLDGRCADAAYLRDDDPMRLRSIGASLVEARAIRTGRYVVVCFAGMRLNSRANEVAGIRVRTTSQGRGALSDKDLGFFIRSDGRQFGARGTASGRWTVDPAVDGLLGAAALGESTWSAELRIDADQLGSWGRETRVQAVIYSEQGESAEIAWPRNSQATRPESWGALVLGRLPQKIEFTGLDGGLAEPDLFDPLATASSGLPVAVSVGGACSMSGSRVKMQRTGACTVIASQSGNASYSPAPSVTRSFVWCSGKQPRMLSEQGSQSCLCACSRPSK